MQSQAQAQAPAPYAPPFNEFHMSEIDTSVIVQEIKNKTLQEAYNLLVLLNGTDLQLATTESLTAGLIMSTLVNIPWAGWHKYGCFGVYDTDAKRVFNSVKVDDVYTHKCAKEMAIGLLKNSNATLAISVTGNSMPLPSDLKKLGEVFIGIAGYRENISGKDEIIYTTKVINNCLEDDTELKQKCMEWLGGNKSIDGKQNFAPRAQTAMISILIRNNTAKNAYIECQKFIKNNKLIRPDFITEQKKTNEIHNTGVEDCEHKRIPTEKYPRIIEETCVNVDSIICSYSKSCKRINVKEISTNTATTKMNGSSRYKRQISKTRKNKTIKQ